MTSAWHTKGPPPRRAPRLPVYCITLTTKTVSADLASDVRLPTGHICLVINDEGTVWACGAAPPVHREQFRCYKSARGARKGGVEAVQWHRETASTLPTPPLTPPGPPSGVDVGDCCLFVSLLLEVSFLRCLFARFVHRFLHFLSPKILSSELNPSSLV